MFLIFIVALSTFALSFALNDIFNTSLGVLTFEDFNNVNSPESSLYAPTFHLFKVSILSSVISSNIFLSYSTVATTASIPSPASILVIFNVTSTTPPGFI